MADSTFQNHHQQKPANEICHRPPKRCWGWCPLPLRGTWPLLVPEACSRVGRAATTLFLNPVSLLTDFDHYISGTTSSPYLSLNKMATAMADVDDFATHRMR